MSLIEEIRRRLEGREAENNARELDSTRRRSSEEAKKRADREAYEREARKMIAESAVLEKLAKIKEGLQPNGQLSYNGSDSVSFIWGIQNSNYGIRVNANPNQDCLSIIGSTSYELRNKRWKDGKTIDNALASAFVDPSNLFERVHRSWDE